MSAATTSLGDDVSSWLNAASVGAELVVDPGLLSQNGGLAIRTDAGEVENRTDVTVGRSGRRGWCSDGW